MLFLDGVYIDTRRGAARFRWVQAPSSAELTGLAHTIAHRVGRFLERQGLLERDVESYLAGDAVDDDPMTALLGHSMTYRIAVGPQAGRKVYTLQTLPGNRTIAGLVIRSQSRGQSAYSGEDEQRFRTNVNTDFSNARLERIINSSVHLGSTLRAPFAWTHP